MPLLTIAAIVVFIGYSILTQVTDYPAQELQASPDVKSMTDEASASATPVANASSTPSPSSTSRPRSTSSSGTSKIDISVDAVQKSSGEKLIYPGASSVGGHYETDVDGDDVYTWYKNEMQKRNYSIRNNVRTKANDKFKAVLQGVNGDTGLKVSIDQENAGAKTIITLE